ncbi:MAG: translin family protein [Actinomycetota bacterium]|nr:translin family protein [Actinomycetota bacterium]
MFEESEKREVVSELKNSFDSIYTIREESLKISRQAIQYASKSIRSVHRSELIEAEQFLLECQKCLSELMLMTYDYPMIKYNGFVVDAEKEMVEASLVLAFEKDKILLFPSDLNVSSVGYIGGLGDAIGEWRRRALDLLRELDIDSSSKYLSIMELSMDILSELDYPDGMTGGLRRIADNARAIIERTRSDITNATVQAQLRV